MRFFMSMVLGVVLVFGWSVGAWAKVDLVTVPSRDQVQLTIYNSADLTLARESRALTLKEGINELQFSWANTLIDPTSLEMIPKTHTDQIDILDLTFPPRVKDLGVWHIKSALSGRVPVEISYLTSGLSWRAFYLGTLSVDEKTMRLSGYVRVTNNSGEDYANAQVRLIVGKVHMIDEIAALARREHPYGRQGFGLYKKDKSIVRKAKNKRIPIDMVLAASEGLKDIVKEGISEYFLYTIEGRETIANGWSKRLPSFEVDAIPVKNLYKYEQERYGVAVTRFLSFRNDEEHKLGDTPIPGGAMKVFRQVLAKSLLRQVLDEVKTSQVLDEVKTSQVDQARHLSFQGASSFKYIPVGEDVELNLGAVENVIVEPKLMKYQSGNYMFDRQGNVSGWDDVEDFQITVKNTRAVAVKVEIRRNFSSSSWKINNSGDYGEYAKVDNNTVKYTLELPPRTKKVFTYVLTTHQGKRGER